MPAYTGNFPEAGFYKKSEVGRFSLMSLWVDFWSKDAERLTLLWLLRLTRRADVDRIPTDVILLRESTASCARKEAEIPYIGGCEVQRNRRFGPHALITELNLTGCTYFAIKLTH